ncbi:MAG: glycerol-3-phosphate dehydrogenase subunit GlpB [Alistipes sp.]|nr:glycerol-3-phosphate dehydrogenase subunit GlpB [Alistipes sp.]
MRYDSVIIGGGLSGLVCGLRLAKAGKRCVIISAGQSALHFSSGSFDLLGALPSGESVGSPAERVAQLIEQEPSHPYAKIGAEAFVETAEAAKQTLVDAGVRVSGDAAQNHYRLTPMGTLKATWLTLDGYVRSATEEGLEWKNVVVMNAEGFLDFYTQFIVDELRKKGTTCRVCSFSLAALDAIRNNPTEMRSANIARIFDGEECIAQLSEIISREAGDSDAVLLPAFLGINRYDVLDELKRRTGRECAVIATLPPSVPGIRTQIALRRAFERAGGVYMLGDTVAGYDEKDGRIERVYTVNHGDIGFSADEFVLATGSFFSRGLEATREAVIEPLFGVDVEQAASRGEWFERDLFAKQPFESFGVATDGEFRALRGGKPLQNLYVCGAGLSGYNPLTEGCGAGVSMLSAVRVSDNILKR